MIPSIDEHVLYKGAMFISKNELKTTLGRIALKDKFEYRIRRSSKTHFKASCKDIGLMCGCDAKGSYWIVVKFVKIIVVNWSCSDTILNRC